jgi:hypothetical protein
MPNDNEKVVRITLNGSGLPVPDQDPIVVKKDSQKIRWCADFEFQIEMDGYTDLKYASGGGSDCAFRCTTGTFKDVRTYKYAITANGQTNDPEVDVRP